MARLSTSLSQGSSLGLLMRFSSWKLHSIINREPGVAQGCDEHPGDGGAAQTIPGLRNTRLSPELSEGCLHALPPQTASPRKLPRPGPSGEEAQPAAPGKTGVALLADIAPARMVSGP